MGAQGSKREPEMKRKTNPKRDQKHARNESQNEIENLTKM